MCSTQFVTAYHDPDPSSRVFQISLFTAQDLPYSTIVVRFSVGIPSLIEPAIQARANKHRETNFYLRSMPAVVPCDVGCQARMSNLVGLKPIKTPPSTPSEAMEVDEGQRTAFIIPPIRLVSSAVLE
ncbi:hypothetical protein CHU98_g8721 [Xylaria longipes]|nr:hypothetical protein CHU98_g8721 [Xylaria longipes]